MDKGLAVTRFISPIDAKRFMNIRSTIAPSLGIHSVEGQDNSGALNFGDVGFLGSREEMNPERNKIYKHDAWTLNSPRIYPWIEGEPRQEFNQRFGVISDDKLDAILSNSLSLSDPEFLKAARRYYNLHPDEVEKDPRAFGQNYMTGMRNFVEKNATEAKSPAIENLNDESVRDFIAENPYNNHRPHWMKFLAPFNEPIKDYKELQRVLTQSLNNFNGKGALAPHYAADSLEAYLLSEIIEPRSNQTYKDKLMDDDIYQYLTGGGLINIKNYNNNHKTENSDGRERARRDFIARDLDAQLRLINKFIKNPDAPAKNSRQENQKSVAEKINLLDTDYLEAKSQRIMHPQHFVGVIHPDTIDSELENSLQNQYKENRIPYHAISVDWKNFADKEDAARTNRRNKFEALRQLMSRLGMA